MLKTNLGLGLEVGVRVLKTLALLSCGSRHPSHGNRLLQAFPKGVAVDSWAASHHL